MISPFEVYLVMQLDSVNAFFFIASLFFVVVAAVLAIGGAMKRDIYGYNKEHPDYLTGIAMHKQLKKLTAPFFICCAITALLPSSKTAAAMIILPALTSKEVTEPLAAEGKELYALAKQALRDAVDAKDTKPEPSK